MHEYRYAPGFRQRIPAQTAGEELEKLREAGNGILTPQTIVDAAADPAAPLHPAFTWDDAAAARKCRLQEAGYLTRSLVVVFHHEAEERTVRAFVNVQAEPVTAEDAPDPARRQFAFSVPGYAEPLDGDTHAENDNGHSASGATRAYIHMIDAMSDSRLRAQILARGKQEFSSLRRRYAEYQEFAAIFQAIDTHLQHPVEEPA